jgi:hypothetical protein
MSPTRLRLAVMLRLRLHSKSVLSYRTNTYSKRSCGIGTTSNFNKRRSHMKKLTSQLMVLLVLVGVSAPSYSQALPTQSRGELLYTTHCISCHTTQMHWRNDKQAYDWDSLKVQVRRWQKNASLQWSEADITEVSRYLNETIYRYPTPVARAELVSRPHHPSNQQTK